MRVLVTGGGGFLGRAVVEQLLQERHTVRSFSRRKYPVLESLGVEIFNGDIADSLAVEKACQNCEIVYHVAAKAGSWGDYGEYFRTNVEGTKNVIEACHKHQISRLIYTSSPSVVFNGEDMEGVDESMPYATHYKSPYAATKALGERLILEANNSQLATVALRPHLIWGPRDTHLIPGILARQRQGRLRKIRGCSKQVDVTYIDNAAAAHLLAAEHLSPGAPIAGKAFFISNGEPVLLWDFINYILEAAELPSVTRSLLPRSAYIIGWFCELLYKIFPFQGEPPITRFLAQELSTAHWFNISAARRGFGYEPIVSNREGLLRLRRWLMKKKEDQEFTSTSD